MFMESIELHRHFFKWTKGRENVPIGHEYIRHDLLKWDDLHKSRRVVVLAEGGTGKTVEFKRQAKLLSSQGKFAFYCMLEYVAQHGLDDVLSSEGGRLERWRQSEESAWFFIDSIDEAKLKNIHFEHALKRIAAGIAGHEGRAFIVLSGRHTEWEGERDATRLREILPLPAPEQPMPDLRALVSNLLGETKLPAPPVPEAPLIVVLAALDHAQIRLYCEEKGVQDVERFLVALRKANLSRIATRPLDLDWLAAYWRDYDHLGTHAEMVEKGLIERLKEKDPDRSRRDELSVERAMLGLERIGAALVLGHTRAIDIPDMDAHASDSTGALDVRSVLHDWSASDLVALLNRAVFEPESYGRTRLHNDNQGVVRSYLTSRWLLRLRRANLPARRLNGLLFASIYGIDLVRPSLRETTAWLSIDDTEIALEVIRREPEVLLSCGDPASLPEPIRSQALFEIAKRMRDGQEPPRFDQDYLARFAQSDMGRSLRVVWEENADHGGIRHLVLMLIWLGAVHECADIAASAAFGSLADVDTLHVAGEAVLAAGDHGLRHAYAAFVIQHCAKLPEGVLASAIEELCPQFIGVDDLVDMLDAGLLLGDTHSGPSLEWAAANIVAHMPYPEDVDKLIRRLLDLDVMKERTKGSSEFDDFPTRLLAAAAARRLALSGPDTVPDAPLDAVLFICAHLVASPHVEDDALLEALRQFRETPARRRVAFWRAAQSLAHGKALDGTAPEAPYELASAGWDPGLHTEDLDWLLSDGPERSLPSERRLAANMAMAIFDEQGRPEAMLAQIKDRVGSCEEMRETIEEFLKPRPSHEERLAAMRLRSQDAHAERARRLAADVDQWVALVEALRNDNDLQRRLASPAPGVPSDDFFNLWRLLSEANRNSRRYAVENVAQLAILAGEEVAAAFANEACRFWRERTPAARTSSGAPAVDILALSGVAIEASGDPLWANRLNADEARRATEYATLEIGRLPMWTEQLAMRWPDVVRDVLMPWVRIDMAVTGANALRASLEYIDSASGSVAGVMAGPIWHEVEQRTDLGADQLRPIVSIVSQHLPEKMKQRAYQVALERFATIEDPAVAARYLGLACSIDAHGATEALDAKIEMLDEAGKTTLVARVLPEMFGWRRASAPGIAGKIAISTLRQLVVIAYRNVRLEDDNDRTNGGVYSPDPRDIAEEARSASFNMLVETPGKETFEALESLRVEPGFPVQSSRLEALARDRAAADSEDAPWHGDRVLRFETDCEKRPTTGPELIALALDRLEDLQHDLLNADFAQGPILAMLPDEAAVQVWLADQLRLTQGSSYLVVREPELVNRKKPDIALAARAAAAKIHVEIKVAESWSRTQLLDALETQLCEQYLRARNCREGLLILVHQTPRAKGWEDPDGKIIGFDEVVKIVRERAQEICRTSLTGPQPQVAVIDVHTCAK